MSPGRSTFAAWAIARRSEALLGLVGDRAHGGLGADAVDPSLVVDAEQHPEHVGPVIAAGHVALRAPADERAAAAEVLMGEAPVALDVDQSHAAAGAAGPLPRGAGADAVGRRAEVALAAAQVVSRARGGGERDRRLVVGELHDRVLAQAVGQVGSSPAGPAWTPK